MARSDPSDHLDEDILTTKPGKWTLVVVSRLATQKLRFNELRRDLGGVSQKTLTVTLRHLERDGFVTRTAFATIPPRVEYELTSLGQELLALTAAFEHFADRHRADVELARRRFDARQLDSDAQV